MSAGITALVVVYGQHTPAPEGYTKIPVDLSNGAGGEYIYVCYTTVAGDPINFIQVFAGDSEDFEIQNGYEKLPYDLNKGARGKYIYLCYTKEQVARPVMDLNVVQGSSPHVYPTSEWIRINQDCSEGAGGDYTDSVQILNYHQYNSQLCVSYFCECWQYVVRVLYQSIGYQ